MTIRFLLLCCLFAAATMQAQVYKTVNCTAGALSTLLTAPEKTTITNLTLTGIINSEDFSTMKLYMPALTNIDMSAVTVEAYGSYLANGIPNSAFSYRILLKSLLLPNTVTSIGNSAFEGCNGLTSLIVPSSVTSIGNSIFSGCSGLTSLTLSSLVTSIASGAFSGCSKLTLVTIPNSVTSIGQNAFSWCSGLTSVTIPNSVTSIGQDAFSWCSGITSVTIPNSVTSIGSGAFYGCSGISVVAIPFSVTTMGENAFGGCSGVFNVEDKNPNYSSKDGVLFNKDQTTLIQFSSSKTGSYDISTAVTTIESYAFAGCNKITSVKIPNSVTTIGSSAFASCHGLTSITISNSLTSIPSSAFYGCRGLTTVNIPTSVKSIGSSAFYGCSGLTSVIIPASVTSIGEGVFGGCSGLTLVDISSSINSIGNRAFQGCSGAFIVATGNANFSSKEGVLFNKNQTSLIQCPTSKTGSYNTPNSVTTIGGGAFYGCNGLTAVTIPISVKSIQSDAFYDCSGLTSISIAAKTPINLNASPNVFNNVNKITCTLYVPVGSKAAYQAAIQWKDFQNIVEVANVAIEKTEVEPSRLFYANHQLTIMGVTQPNARAMLYSLDGKMVSEHTLQQNQNVVNLPHLLPGIYMVNIQDGNTRYSSKILVNN